VSTVDLDVIAAIKAAVAVTTEITIGDCDADVIAAIAASVPEQMRPNYELLVQTFQANYDVAGPPSLTKQGLHAARREAGLEP
jgi:hypothetical protein